MKGTIRRKASALIAASMMCVGVGVFAASPAMAASIVKGPYDTQAQCKAQEAAYARAVVIDLQCFRYNGTGRKWYFAYYI